MSFPLEEQTEPGVEVPASRLGEILLGLQKISRHDLDRALEVQRSMGGRLGRLLISLGGHTSLRFGRSP